MKDELDAKIMTEFSVSRAKIYSYLTDNNDEIKKKVKEIKKYVKKWILKFKVYKNCLKPNQLESQMEYLK